MKKAYLTLFFSCIFLSSLLGQEVYIEGPTTLCPGECGTYIFSSDEPTSYVNWTGQTVINTQFTYNFEFYGNYGTEFTICAYEIQQDFDGLGEISASSNVGDASIIVQLIDAEPIELSTVSDVICEDDDTNCRQVCVGKTTDFIVSPSGENYNWLIEGSEDYEIYGNTASVTWDEVGEGLVSVETTSSSTPFGIDCFFDENATLSDGVYKYFLHGGVFPIEVIVSSSLSSYTVVYESSFPEEGVEFPNIFDSYNVSAIDATGNTAYCSSFPQGFACDNNIQILNYSPPTNCSSCNGIINFTVSSGYNVIWSDGSTEPTRNNLCPGTYTFTATSPFSDCDFTETYTLSSDFCSEQQDFPLNFNAELLPNNSWWAQVEGGVAPYTLTITDYEDNSFDFPISETGTIITNSIAPLSINEWSYDLTITDGVGEEISLSRSIPKSNSSIEIPIEISPATDCGACNGVIDFGWIGSSLYSEIYYDGSQIFEGSGPNLRYLCPGSYYLKIYNVPFGNPSYTNMFITIGDNCSSFSNSTCSATATQCIQVLPNPEAQFITLPAAADDVVEICNQQSITFQNESTGAESFIWDFGDFNTSVAANPEHIYANPGTYNVTCIARNDCFCSDTTSLTVNVLEADIPEIECVGTVCVGDTVTYTSPAECSIFAWQISTEGNLIEGGGINDNYAQVLWENGPVGTVSLSVGGCGTSTLCSQANVAQIPILSGDAVIEGPAKVCNSTQVIYSIPKYDGSDFQWTVSEFGTITSGENTHQITVMWEGATPNNNQSVEVVYENCWLECGGTAQMDVSIVPEFYTQGVPLICENESSIFYARETANNSPASVNWTVLNPEGTSVFTANSVVSAQIPFEFGNGTYTILTTPADINDYCTASYELKVEVSVLPDAPIAINGQSQICLGETYSYSAQSNLSNPIFTWTINNAGTFTTQTGNTAVVTWQGEGAHLISVTQTSADGLDCTSESITFNVETVDNITMSGASVVCAESTANYTATNLQGVSYDWSITPENAGTIVNGGNTNSVEIYWAYGGNAAVNLQLCGQNLSQNIDVKPLPSPQVIQADYLCPNQTGTVSLTQNYQSYLWKDENGTTLSAAPTVDLTSGYYEVEVTDADGCVGNSVFNIGDFATNDLNISTGSFTSICPAAGIGFPILYAPELEEGFTYEWFFNNVSLSIDATQIQTTEFGTYTVEATNMDGCTATSNGISISEACGQGGPPPPPPAGCELDFSFQSVGDCKTFDFMPTSGNIISIVSWDFGDGSTSTELNPQHTYDELGLYHIILIANVIDNAGNPALCLAEKALTFPLKANFGFEANCAGEAVQFNDISLTVGEGEIVNRVWDFDDPTSGDNSSNELNPSHVFSSPGTYSVSLIVMDATGCSDERIRTIQILAPPTVGFLTPEQTCAATALPFSADVSNNVVNYTWDFGDPASGNANAAQSQNVWHNYENVGSYELTLTGSDIYGCEDADTQSVVTEPNSLTGNNTVSPANTICEGSSVSLNAPEGGTIWQWSTGETTENITVSEAGNYQVTLTSDNGCTYIPAGQIIEILPLPSGDIYAVELDEFDNPISYIFETYEVCFGEDVYLQIEENELYSYEWSTGSTITEEEFSEDRDNLLEVGTTDISVTITDLLTGCSSISTYSVTVHPQPENILISSDTPSPICGNSSAILSVENADTNLNYIWNTGEFGPQITLIAGGEYWVRAINEFGCEGESNHIIVENAPDIDKVPDGCHSLCEADTICLPILENIALYQWYLNGEVLTSETANSPDLIMTEDGEYQLFMQDVFGCTSWSDPLNVEFYEGTGTVIGQVWLDVNENGIIDDEDENLSGINIQITDENGLELENISVSEGYYGFQNIPTTTDYSLSLDTLSLPPDVTYTIIENTTTLQGCDDLETVDWLVLPYCAPLTGTLEIPACNGISAIYETVEIMTGESQNFSLMAVNGCDSILTVTAYAASPDISAELLEICEDETIEINGEILNVGDDIEVNLFNQLGCDSIVTYSIISANSLTSEAEISICEDESIEINGQILQVGDVTDILFANQAGCDSIVTYTVLSAASTPTNQSIEICEGESTEIEGTTVNAGETVTIELTNQAGCDSLLTITAGTLSPDFSLESVQICEGDIFEYQDTELEVGETQSFILVNQDGCDSLVEMTVNAFTAPIFFFQSSLACPDINDGSFIIENPNGGSPPFEYSLDGNEWQLSPEFTEMYGGNYIVQIRDANNCIYEEELEISTAPELVLTAEDQIFPCDADEIILEIPTSGGQGIPNFTWSTGDTTATISIEDTGIYSLTVIDECYEQTADLEVVRGMSSTSSAFYIPTAFSPNGDTANDEFCPLGAADVEVLTYHIRIFDRWGNFVFESFVADNCWDGTYGDKVMNNAVFVYVLQAEVLVCEEQKSVLEYGDVTIVR
jgi:gliding motility-associated-like protein